MIQVSHISKNFAETCAVNDVSLEVGEGNIFGLLGPNAAGKTTLIRMLCGIIRRDSGDVRINNKTIEAARHDFGYVAQHFGQYEELSVWENLKFYASMYGVNDKLQLLSLLERYQLMPFKNRRAGQLSGGYQRRLALACALAHDPAVLFLDEPTAGIDPVTRKHLWDDFYSLATEGKTLFVTTHYMEEAQRCNHLAFISHGQIVAQGSPLTIRNALGDTCVYRAEVAYLPEVHQALHDLPGMILVNQFGKELRMVVEPQLSKQILQAAISKVMNKAVELEQTQANLEDVFIALTQEENKS